MDKKMHTLLIHQVMTNLKMLPCFAAENDATPSLIYPYTQAQRITHGKWSRRLKVLIDISCYYGMLQSPWVSVQIL